MLESKLRVLLAKELSLIIHTQIEALRGIQQVEESTVEPPPSEKHCKRAVLNIVGLQMISRGTPFLRCQADQQSVLLDSDFE